MVKLSQKCVMFLVIILVVASFILKYFSLREKRKHIVEFCFGWLDVVRISCVPYQSRGAEKGVDSNREKPFLSFI